MLQYVLDAAAKVHKLVVIGGKKITVSQFIRDRYIRLDHLSSGDRWYVYT